MSFAWTAIGSKEEVLAQLPLVKSYDSAVGDGVRDVLLKAFEGEPELDPAGGYEYKYTVNASGHSGGGSALSLTVSVTAAWVPIPPPAQPTAPVQAADVQEELPTTTDGNVSAAPAS